MWGKASNGGRRVIEFFDDADEANARVLELKRMRDRGVPFELVSAQDERELTLGEACAALLMRKRAIPSRKTGRQLRDSGYEWWVRIVKPWRADPFGSTPLSLLRRSAVEDAVLARAVKHPKSAGDELYGLKAVLKYSGQRGARFDAAILAIEPLARTKRERRALTAEQLAYLAAHAPEYARREILFLGTVGNRIGEVHTLTEDRIDLKERTEFIPWHLCKEGADKTIDLTPDECALLREQLLARAPGTNLVFPSKTGRSWAGNSKYGDWHRLVWSKAVRRASAAWRQDHGLRDGAATPFEDQLIDDNGEPRLDTDGNPMLDALEPHDLRATAITLMRDAGFTKEQAAARVGHADSGELLDRIYDRGDRRARADVRGAIDQLDAGGLLAALGSRR
jgi:integrase